MKSTNVKRLLKCAEEAKTELFKLKQAEGVEMNGG